MKDLSRMHAPIMIIALFLIAGSLYVLGWYMRLERPSASAVLVSHPTSSEPSPSSSNVGADLYEKLQANTTATIPEEPYQNPFE